MRVTLDWESASACDLSEAGSWAYWEHPTTEVLCLCAVTDEGLGWTWIPGVNDECLEDFALWAADPTVIFEAHKADFEQAGWEMVMVRQLGLPRLPPERWDDTMARCYYRGLPGALDLASRELKLTEQKDKEGRDLTLSLSKPMTAASWMAKRPDTVTQAEWKRRFVKGTYDRSRPTLERVARYCMQDVRTEMALSEAIGPLSDYERRVWALDQKMNQRGLKVDLSYVRAAKAVVAEASKPLLAEFDKATGGLAPTQTKRLLEWCNENGLAIDSLAKDNLKVYGITGLDDEGDDDDDEVLSVPVAVVPEHVRRVLSIRAVLGSASIAKLDRILTCAGSDSRVRYTVQYHGAGTGRWAGRLFQPQNFPRGKIEGGHDPEALVQAIMYAASNPRAAVDYIQCLYGDPIAAVASGLRHALVSADDALYCAGDFAGIEARDVLALAGQYDKCELMAGGFDVYLDMAEDIYRQPKGSWALDPSRKAELKAIKEAHIPERTIGKNTVLGCGFGMGWKKFRDRYCPTQSEDFARGAISAYRDRWAPKVPKLWAALEETALKAVYDKWHYTAYGVTYEYCGDWLACRLLDGQVMWYRHPEFCRRPMPWDASDVRDGWSYWAMKTGRWKRIFAYGGLLTENVVQKRARGYLVEAMFRLEANGFPLVLTVHDENLAEVERARADQKAYEQIMAEPTEMSRAYRVPIAVEGWVGARYKK